MRIHMISIVTLSLLLLIGATANAQISSGETIGIPLTPEEVPAGVTWSKSAALTETGLTVEQLPSDTSARFWVQTQPLAAGMSWRPPTSITIAVEVDARPHDFSFVQAAVRYSCDRVHWSTWYTLARREGEGGEMTPAFSG